MITFTQGDDATLEITAIDGDGNPITLTGAAFTTQIKGRDNVLSFENAKHEANADQVGNKGKFTLALSKQDTSLCGVGAAKDIVTKIVISDQAIYLHGTGLLTVLENKPKI